MIKLSDLQREQAIRAATAAMELAYLAGRIEEARGYLADMMRLIRGRSRGQQADMERACGLLAGGQKRRSG